MDQLLTVVIPVYNQVDWLGDALENLACQSYKNFLVVVGDNCSEDDIESKVKEFSARLNIIHRRDEEFLPKAANWTRAISYSESKFTMLHHADDLLHKDCVKILYEMFARHEDVDFFHGRFRPIYADGSSAGGLSKFPFSYKYRYDNSLLNLICTPSICGLTFKTELFNNTGGFDNDLVHLHDWELNYRMLKNCKSFMYVNKEFGSWRTGKLKDELMHVQNKETLKLLRKFNPSSSLILALRVRQYIQSQVQFYEKHKDWEVEFLDSIWENGFQDYSAAYNDSFLSTVASSMAKIVLSAYYQVKKLSFIFSIKGSVQ